MSDKDIFVICVNENVEHTDDSVLKKCCKCGRNVWVSSVYADSEQKPICFFCVKVMAYLADDKVELAVDKRALADAIKYFFKRKKEWR